MHIFSQTFIAGAPDVDCFSRLRPSALQFYLQEAATGHVNALEMTREQLMTSHGAIWIIMRLDVTLDAPIKYLQEVEIRTWRVPAGAATFGREYEILADGKSVGHASSLWVIADYEAHRIIRPSALKEAYPCLFDTQPPKYGTPAKLAAVEEWGGVKEHRVAYSDLDLNKHVNNCKYTEFACDALEMENESDRYVSGFCVNFIAEAKKGDTLALQTSRGEQTARVRGLKDETVCFEIDIKVGKR